MSKSLWAIAVMGFLAVAMLVVAMWASLTAFQQSPASQKTKLALQIRNEFVLESASTEIRGDLEKTFLRVTYVTTRDTGFDLSAVSAEMQRVGEYALEKYEGTDKRHIHECRITRTRMGGSGCFKSTDVAHHAIPNPDFGKMTPPRRLSPIVVPPPADR